MTIRKVAVAAGALAWLTMGIAGCATAEAPPPSGWMGNVYVGSPKGASDTRKMFIATFRFTDSGVQPVDVTVAYGTPPRVPDGGSEYVLRLLGAGERVLSTRTAPDPRAAIVEKEGNVRLSEGLLTARLPFDGAGLKVTVSDAAGKTLAEVDLARAIGEFCRRAPRDPDCAAIENLKR